MLEIDESLCEALRNAMLLGFGSVGLVDSELDLS